MSNSVFRFKQFEVSHEKSAMKVGTDGVLLGAWVDVEHSKNVLDLGTGSGLIALMLVQRNISLEVNAIDIDPEAVKQASINFNNSKWTNRLKALNVDFKKLKTNVKYDTIVSNPPYFEKSLKNTDIAKSKARHADVSLSIESILKYSKNLLSSKGKLSVILPVEQGEKLIDLSGRYGFYLSRLTKVKPTPKKSFKRYLIELSLVESKVDESLLIIEDKGRHQYSNEYISLTKAFYLNM